MQFNYRYAGSSKVAQSDDGTSLSFVPDALRPPTFFKGRLGIPLEFREAMSALHDVVISDLRFQPKDRTKYLAWRATQEDVDLVAVTRDKAQVARELAELQAQLAPIEAQVNTGRAAFHSARRKYWNYLYERDREMWFKLDPVITVHPDQVFFECFSRDESSYGKLSARYDAFDQMGDKSCGTTNVDYSDGLYAEFQKIRSYKHTSLDVDSGGFGVTTSGEDKHHEVKIDVPDSWVRGFLQVSSAMTMPVTSVELHPMDIHNLLLVLRRNKEMFGPRSLRYRLMPGEPVVIVVEPWNIEVRCPRSIYRGDRAVEVRAWGRRRLYILERLLPRAKKVTVHLLGTGMPSFYVVDLGALSFTLGLSGWTHNDWSKASNFDLMAAREDVDDDTRQRVFAELGKSWLAPASAIASTLGLAQPLVASALAGWVQAGRAIYDLEAGVYRKRELTREPLPVEKLRFASERETSAAAILHQGKVAIDEAAQTDGHMRIVGRVAFHTKIYNTKLVLDADRRLTEAECSCDYYTYNRLRRGPCDHMLALRSAQARGLSDVIPVSDPKAARRALIAAQASAPAAPPERPRAPEAPPLPEPEPGPKKPSWWKRMVAKISGKPIAPAPPTPEDRLGTALDALGTELVVKDRAALIAALRAVYDRETTENGRLFALVIALRASEHVSAAPSDQVIIQALRTALS